MAVRGGTADNDQLENGVAPTSLGENGKPGGADEDTEEF